MSNSGDSNSQAGQTNQQTQNNSNSNSTGQNATSNLPSSNLSRSNMNTYNSPMNNGYSGYGTSGYNSYSSGYGQGYSGYGSSYGSGYGSGYGSSFGGYGSSYGSGYGSGYGSYNSTNNYSNHYSKPIPQGPDGQPLPPPSVRQDVWGFLNGFQALLHVLYAGTGIVHFGKMFLKMSFKVIKVICGKSAGLVFKLTGFGFLKKIMERFSSTDNWSSEFNFADNPFDSAWGNNENSSRVNNTIFGKILLVLRICSLLGALISFFLRSKARGQHPPVQVEMMDMEAAASAEMEQKVVEFDQVKNLYDEIKLIETDDDKDCLHKSIQAIQEEKDQFIADMNELDKSVAMESSPTSSRKSKKDLAESIHSNNSSNLDMKLDMLLQEALSPRSKENSLTKEETTQAQDIVQQENVNILSQVEISAAPIIIPTPEPVAEVRIESEPFNKLIEESIAKPVKEQIVSEDFWKNDEVYKKIETIQMEEKKANEENKKPAFELPSVLQNLRAKGSSANKPWLMKKKKVETPVPELPVEAAPQIVLTETTTPEEGVNEAKTDVVETPQVMEVPEKTEEITVQ